MRRIIFAIFLFLTAFSCLAYGQKVEILYFYSDTCGVCLSLKQEFLPEFKEKYKNDVVFTELSIYQKENLERLFSIAETLGEKKPMVPAIVVADNLLIGKEQIKARLGSIVNGLLEGGSTFAHRSEISVEEVFGTLSVAALIGAGLLDGINPCAFAVIVFFISFLSVYGYDRREVFAISVFYILAVFLTYFAMGLGLFKFVYALQGFYVLVKIFYYTVAGVCFVLGSLAIYDYAVFRKKNSAGTQLLQLPSFIKKKINVVIGEKLRHKQGGMLWLAAISFSVGVMVSLLEAVCTGQVYVPTIFFILKLPHLRVRAFFYLIFYNVMFILPLAVIFILSFLGVSSVRFNSFLKKNLGIIKLLMAFLFFALGTAILSLH
ncbi:MAG: hypothetical protein JXD21_01730 [Candidatus Omnitrophica bacterium]|nr:hypothetical protein [Candidatus Omnitrophota bacterium]